MELRNVSIGVCSALQQRPDGWLHATTFFFFIANSWHGVNRYRRAVRKFPWSLHAQVAAAAVDETGGEQTE